jgi:hypothetical protein
MTAGAATGARQAPERSAEVHRVWLRCAPWTRGLSTSRVAPTIPSTSVSLVTLRRASQRTTPAAVRATPAGALLSRCSRRDGAGIWATPCGSSSRSRSSRAARSSQSQPRGASSRRSRRRAPSAGQERGSLGTVRPVRGGPDFESVESAEFTDIVADSLPTHVRTSVREATQVRVSRRALGPLSCTQQPSLIMIGQTGGRVGAQRAALPRARRRCFEE